MDDIEKRKLRKTARIVHWVAQGTLVLVLIQVVAAALSHQIVGHWRAMRPLTDAAHELIMVNARLIGEKTDRLMAFAPPTDSLQWYAWSRAVREHMEQPAAVFVKEDSTIHWYSIPEQYLSLIPQVPPLFDMSRPPKERAKADTIGNLVRWKSDVGAEDSEGFIVAYAPVAGGVGWGVLYAYRDGFPLIFESLRRCSLAAHMERPADLLSETFQLERNDRTFNPGLCVWRHDSLLYATPSVDTTHTRYDFSLGDFSCAAFASDITEQSAYLGAKNSWVTAIWLVVIMIVVNVFWRWIKKLTIVK